MCLYLALPAKCRESLAAEAAHHLAAALAVHRAHVLLGAVPRRQHLAAQQALELAGPCCD